MDSILRILRTQEYRRLSKVKKALKLIEEEGVSLRQAHKATGASISSIFRAKRAREEARDIGTKGRPKILGNKGEACLIKAIIEADKKKKPMSYQKLKEAVRAPPSTFFLFLQPISQHKAHFKLYI